MAVSNAESNATCSTDMIGSMRRDRVAIIIIVISALVLIVIIAAYMYTRYNIFKSTSADRSNFITDAQAALLGIARPSLA